MNESYLEAVKILSNKRRVNAFVRELNIDQIEQIISSLQEASADRVAELKREREQEAERKEKIQAYIEMMEKDGIEVGALLDVTQGKKEVKERQPRAKKAPKYEYYKDGELVFWTGQGRTPKVIAEAIANGQSLDDFLIKS